MSDGAAIEPWNVASPDGARVLLFSMRNLTRHVSRCGVYEFERVIADCDDVDILAPRRPAGDHESGWRRHVRKLLRLRAPLIDHDVHADKDYDLFVAFVRSENDLRYVERVAGAHDRCRVSVCVLDELRPDAIGTWPRSGEVFGRFDCLFSGIQDSVEPLRRATGRPCHFLPGGVDALKFCPYPGNPPRGIDVYAMGRRPQGMHRALLSRAGAGEIFYLYDTVSNFKIDDPDEHRLVLANLIKRTRYFITFPPKFDRVGEASAERELGLRFFEGAAGGSVMLGLPPSGAAFRDCFDWPDAVIRTPADGAEIAALIGELDRQPDRLARIRRDSVANTLRRHDWIYRWRRLLETVGLPVSSGAIKRELSLLRLAVLVDAHGVAGGLPDLVSLVSRA